MSCACAVVRLLFSSCNRRICLLYLRQALLFLVTLSSKVCKRFSTSSSCFGVALPKSFITLSRSTICPLRRAISSVTILMAFCSCSICFCAFLVLGTMLLSSASKERLVRLSVLTLFADILSRIDPMSCENFLDSPIALLSCFSSCCIPTISLCFASYSGPPPDWASCSNSDLAAAILLSKSLAADCIAFNTCSACFLPLISMTTCAKLFPYFAIS